MYIYTYVQKNKYTLNFMITFAFHLLYFNWVWLLLAVIFRLFSLATMFKEKSFAKIPLFFVCLVWFNKYTPDFVIFYILKKKKSFVDLLIISFTEVLIWNKIKEIIFYQMSRNKHCTPAERRLVLRLKNGGNSLREISTTLNRSLGFVQNALKTTTK